MTQFQNFKFREIIWFIYLEIWWTQHVQLLNKSHLYNKLKDEPFCLDPSGLTLDILFEFCFSTLLQQLKNGWTSKRRATNLSDFYMSPKYDNKNPFELIKCTQWACVVNENWWNKLHFYTQHFKKKSLFQFHFSLCKQKYFF